MQKMFVINFIVSYLPIFLTAFVYVPFGKLLVPYLDVFHVTAQHFAKDGKIETKAFEVNPDRLKKQIIYFTVTAQVVNFLLEGVVPLIKRTIFKAVKEAKSEVRHGNTRSLHNDPAEESAFLDRVRNEAELDVYDVTVDYREMVVQFGMSCPPLRRTCAYWSNFRILVTILCDLATHRMFIPRQQLDRGSL